VQAKQCAVGNGGSRGGFWLALAEVCGACCQQARCDWGGWAHTRSEGGNAERNRNAGGQRAAANPKFAETRKLRRNCSDPLVRLRSVQMATTPNDIHRRGNTNKGRQRLRNKGVEAIRLRFDVLGRLDSGSLAALTGMGVGGFASVK
jgi:hypothetical protein